ncbi:MAG: Smr/MutS family protein [Syntrophorhabdaceae bacterium]|nr:Smr/MutS family protein [Syntrophorhabdaceae bacterium]
MKDKTLTYLDYFKLIELIKGYSNTPYIDDALPDIKPLYDIREIEERQGKIEALMDVIRWDGPLPLSGIPDIRDILKKLSVKNMCLEAGELLMLSDFLRATEGIGGFLRRAHAKSGYGDSIIDGLKPIPQISTRVTRTINGEGLIEDTASYELSRIRSDLFLLRERIKRQLEKIMARESVNQVVQDTYIAIRNGRYVIPLKPNFNQFLKGIVHDYSHTLKTSFVEPLESVEMNNSINMLQEEEREEERRLLTELTDFIRTHTQEIERQLLLVKEIDLYHAFALFSIDFSCVRPKVTEGGAIYIRKAYNPFILISKREQAVPIDIEMDEEKKAMIISGPNAGGKTAALKTIGLISLMAKTGLFIPASGIPRVPIYKHVFALIGDEQDISTDLSSFTAHMMAIKDIYEKAEGGDLILVDEIGGGTEPQEASAISMAIIDAFVEKGCRIVVTTHLNLLKAYGYKNPFAINVATAFDTETKRPLYRLTYGMAGYSNAIHVAKGIAMPEGIIEKSYTYLDKQELMLNELVASLESAKRKVEEELKDIEEKKKEIKRRLEIIDSMKKEHLRRFELRCSEKILELEAQLEEIKREAESADREALKKGMERVKVLKKRYVKKEEGKEEEIKIGDYVDVKNMGMYGQVVDIEKDGQTYDVLVGNMRIKVKKEYLRKTAKPKVYKTPGYNIKPPEGEKTFEEERDIPELNIIGLRVDEAIKELDRFVDKAVVQGVQKIRVIHGIGTGRLMGAVKDRLEKARYVDRIESRGGVTVVNLR